MFILVLLFGDKLFELVIPSLCPLEGENLNPLSTPINMFILSLSPKQPSLYDDDAKVKQFSRQSFLFLNMFKKRIGHFFFN